MENRERAGGRQENMKQKEKNIEWQKKERMESKDGKKEKERGDPLNTDRGV